MKKSVGEALREYRIKAGYTPKEVYEHFGIKQARFSAWERGVSEPSTEMFIKLLNYYGISDIMDALGYDGYNNDGTIRLNVYEVDLIENYRQLSDFNRETVDMLVKRMVDGYSEPARKITRPLYILPASAGTGQFLDSDDYEMMDFPEDVVPSDSTFAVRISGDSMEPTYPDGSVVFVKQAKTLNVGDVGIFVLNDEGFIKRLGKNGQLVSINPAYKPIQLTKYDTFKIVGKVVGSFINAD